MFWKGLSEGMGLVSLVNDWGVPLGLSLELDASATRRAFLERSGVGKVRHVEVEALSLVERKRNFGRFSLWAIRLTWEQSRFRGSEFVDCGVSGGVHIAVRRCESS